MNYRGLDFSQGFGKYQDLLRAAYEQKLAQQHQDFNERIQAQQANALYGFEDPRVNPAANPYFEGPMPLPAPGPQMPPMGPPPVSPFTPRGMPEMALPQGEPYLPAEPGDRRPWSVGRDPAQNPGFMYRTPMDREIHEKASGLVLEDLNKRAAGAQDSQGLSQADRLIRRYSTQEKIPPFVLKQIMDLKKEELQNQNRGSNGYTDIVKAFLDSKPVQATGGTRAGADPSVVLKRKIDTLEGQQKKFEFKPSFRAQGNPRAEGREREQWLQSELGQKWSGLQNQIDGLMNQMNGGGEGSPLIQSGGTAPKKQKMFFDKKKGDTVTKDEMIRRYPQFKAQIELEASK